MLINRGALFVEGVCICEAESRSDPDSKQKTETELTFWHVLPYFVSFFIFEDPT